MSPSPVDRPRSLVSPLAIAVIAAVLVALLLVLYPGRRRALLESAAQYPSAPLGYLLTLAGLKPHDQALARALVGKQIAAGDFAAARRTLAGMNPSAPQTAWLRLQIDWGEYVATRPGDVRHAAAYRRVGADLAALQSADLSGFDDAQLETLAGDFLALGQPQHAAPLFEQLARRTSRDAYGRWAQAGKWWLAAGRPGRARRAWEHALAVASTPARRREAGDQAMRAARMAGGGASLQLAETLLKRRPDDPGLLRQGIDVALAARRPDLALVWSRRLVALRPGDEAAQRQHLDLALADGRPAEALAVARELAQRHPDDWRLQFRLAQLQEWNGDPERALRTYIALAAKHPDPRVDARILALGLSEHAAPAVAGALLRRSRRRRLTPAEMKLLVSELDDQMGQPKRAARILEGWLRDVPADRPLWERLAGIYTNTGQPRRALRTWRHVASRYGRDLAETRARARLQIGQWHFGAALRVMLSLLESEVAARPDDPRYWQELGDLAWLHDDMPSVVRGYGWLYRRRPDALTADDARRLVIAELRTGNLEAAVDVAATVWRRDHDPAPLLLALDGTVNGGRSDLAGRLLALADADPKAFAATADYWRLRGAYLQARGDSSGATAAYRRALQQRPDDADLRAAYLYALIAQGDTATLARALQRWRHGAVATPALWGAYADGYVRLGQPRQALPWFARRAAARPDDVGWLFEYADALEAARRFDGAYRIRRFAYARLRAGVRLGLRPDAATARALLQDPRLGAGTGLRWLQRLLSVRGATPVGAPDFESLVDWNLAHGRPLYAVDWAHRARRDGVRLPAYQRLALALATGDRRAASRLLKNARTLSLGDRIDGLRNTGQDAEALRLALAHLDRTEPWTPVVDRLPRTVAELRARMPRQAGAMLGALRIGDLRAYTEQVGATGSLRRWSVSARSRATQFARKGLAVNLHRLGHEYAGHVELRYRGRRGTTTLEAGRVDTGAVGFSQFALGQSYRFTGRLTADAFVRYHDQTLDSALFRLLGARDSAGLNLQYAVDARDALSLVAKALRYRTRWDDALGSGYEFSGELDHALVLGRSYQFGVRLSAGYIGNQLQAQLPSRVAGRLPAGTGIGALLPNRFGDAGLGISVARGRPDADYPVVGGLRYAADVGVDYIWTDRRVGLQLDLGVGRRLFGNDDLSLFFHLDQTQATTGGTTQTVGLRYRYFFGR